MQTLPRRFCRVFPLILLLLGSAALPAEAQQPTGQQPTGQPPTGQQPTPTQVQQILKEQPELARKVREKIGMSGLTDVFFESDPVFDLAPDAAAKGVKRIAWYDGKATLRSGWAWGQEYLDGGTAAIQATIGKGTAYLFGPEILQRAQPHGTFKFLFNGLYLGTATPGKP